ncbi:putative histone-lysine N-methyltransferase PRDM6 [Dendronephthya gigantea]|uniref:putative histone-lysine N-methyltransferase PRDM6 n=1 Tax=Dendronephthya gigantea TaxID=151771 RepID=UPI00106CBF0B|nr:putative histone-lysine N-methyltransferase PRDM6 [Dendronephthya gigantea]
MRVVPESKRCNAVDTFTGPFKMHSSFLKERLPHRGYGQTDAVKEQDLYVAYFNFIPRSSTRPSPDESYPVKPQARRMTPTTNCRSPPFEFTFEDLAFSLRGKSVVQPIDTARIQRKRRMSSSHRSEDAKRGIGYHGNYYDVFSRDSWSIPNLKTRQLNFTGNDKSPDKMDIAPTNAVMSFLPEVQLCMSSLPGGQLGVCSRKEIPKDTVIGPYKGRKVRPEELKMGNGADMSYLWEIYKGGKLDHYLDGSDENISCWMRFIRSARNKEEQNLCAIQHGDNIFYRTLIDISVGTELLVWYEDKYEEYFGIPIFLPSDHHKASQDTLRSPRHCDDQSLRREIFTPAMLKTMERTRLWIDERLGQNWVEDDNIGSKPVRRDSYDDDSSFLGSQNSESETGRTTPEDTESGFWRCSQCQQSFNQRSALRIHVCPTRTSKPFDCGHCSLSFADPNDLRTHVGTHTNDRLFKCGYCGRRFAGATTLTNHIRTHTGEKPFSCEKCGKDFSQASQLSRHQRIPGDCV